MSEYVPTTEGPDPKGQFSPDTDYMRLAYIDRRDFVNQINLVERLSDEELEAEFDRWLDQVKAEARREGQAEAWAEGYDAGELCGLTAEQSDHACPINPYRNGEDRHVDE